MKRIVLLVDDDPDFRRVCAGALQRRGFECLSAGSAEEAMDLAEQICFHHAIVDLNLGEGDSGLTVLRHLAQTQPECRCVMLTGYASIATAVEATRSGVAAYLPKPATIDEILAAFKDGTSAEDPPIPDRPPTPKRLEWEYIQRILLKNRGNISATARELGMHRRTLQRKLAKRPPPR